MTQTVTRRNSEVCTSDFAADPAEREIGSDGPETLHSAMTDSDRRPFDTAAWLAKFGAYFTPPPLLTERRPAVDTMRLYAQRGRYTGSLYGPARRLGLIWLGAVAVPGLVFARVWEWLLERPTRFAVTVLVVKALSTLPPVAWTVDHVIKPSAAAALWLFL